MSDNIKAFPVTETQTVGNVTVTTCNQHGMDLRDYFAGQAISSLIVSQYECGTETTYAQVAYRVADMMIQARGKKS